MITDTRGDGRKTRTNTQPSPLVISHIALRRIVGVIAILLAFALRLGVIAFNHRPPYSVSSYYYSPMRNVLVGSLCVLGVFLIAYKGHDKLETWVTNIAGAAAIGVAFCPTSSPAFRPAWVSALHPIFAAVAMAGLALMALQFTHTKPSATSLDWREELKYMAWTLLYRYDLDKRNKGRDPNKKVRNRIYSSCAWLILAGVILAFVQNFWSQPVKDVTQWLFWFEALAIVAFGVSWLVKGETIFKDKAAAAPPPG